jgi:hypothetical protein
MSNQSGEPSLEAGYTVGGMSGSSPPPPLLPPTFPTGVNPETYRIDTVSHLLKQAAYFSLFSVHNPAIPNVPLPLPGNPRQLVGMRVNEQLHRFDITVEPPTPQRGLRATKVVAQSVARVRIRWLVIPDEFHAAPTREPPPTPLNPRRSQRFSMLDGQFSFDDGDQSGFHGFGAGRTFPAIETGRQVLRLGAVVDILEGLGRFKDHKGVAVVNGFIIPPDVLGLNIMVRLMDPNGNLSSESGLTALSPISDPDPGAVFMTFLGEVDPNHPTTLNRGPDGQIVGSNVHELLRLVHVGFDLKRSKKRISSKTTTGPIVGRLNTILYFNPLNPSTPGTAQAPIPYHTTDSMFTFFDRNWHTIGTLKANIIEGRAFKTDLSGAPIPIFRMGGFGPFIEGAGQFSGVEGMLSMNAAISVFPRTLSNMYVLRIVDPDGKFHESCRQAWS